MAGVAEIAQVILPRGHLDDYQPILEHVLPFRVDPGTKLEGTIAPVGIVARQARNASHIVTAECLLNVYERRAGANGGRGERLGL